MYQHTECAADNVDFDLHAAPCDQDRRASKEAKFLVYLLVLGSPGLLIVDHIHFQYNGIMLGQYPQVLTCESAAIFYPVEL